MMYNKVLFFLAFCFGQAAISQNINLRKTFQPQPAAQVDNIFSGVTEGASAYADVNGDGFVDVLITGRNNQFQFFTALYFNDGQGNFTEAPNPPFAGLNSSALAFADVDGDGDQDFLVSGRSSTFLRKTELYINNGFGVFTLAPNTPFPAVSDGSIAFADVDGDNDQDLVSTGQNNLNQFECALYKNNGSGAFTLQTGQPFIGVRYSDIAFVDVDGDNDQDLMVTGDIISVGSNISNLYLNNGSGAFTLQSNSPFIPVEESAITFLDFDGNQSPDVLITGEDLSSNPVSMLYANTGNGTFALLDSTTFVPVRRGQVAAADVDGNGYPDIYISGRPSSGFNTAELYLNNGDSTFTLSNGVNAFGVEWGDAFLADFDNDSDPDLFVSGYRVGNQFTAILFINDSTGNFYEAGGNYFEGIYDGSLSHADVDGDNDIDLFVSGFDKFRNPTAKLYLNSGGGTFTLSPDTIFRPTVISASTFADVDGDSDADLFLTGLNDQGLGFAELYLNNGSGNFTLSTTSSFQGVRSSAVAFADIDGDNDLDLLTSGRNLVNQRFTSLYTNNGTGTFTAVASTPFPNVQDGSINFADVDNDGDQDVFLTGQSGSSTSIANLYLNDSTGNFTLATGQAFTAVRQSAAQFADVDNDGDQDLIVGGLTSSGPETHIYLNDSTGTFTKDLSNSLTGLFLGTLDADDLDGDGDVDLILTGLDSPEERVSLIYENDSLGNFTLSTFSPLRGLYVSASSVADFSGNQSPDLMLTGMNNSGQPAFYFYANEPCLPVAGVDAITACNSYTWLDGITYTLSDSTAIYTLSSQNGCDSVVTLNLTINYSDSVVENISACNSYTWIDSITYTASNNSASIGFQNASGCDSSVYLNLTIVSVDTSVTASQNGQVLTSNQAGATYQWLDCDNNFAPIPNATNQVYTATTEGNYAVEITLNGCIDTSRCYYWIPFGEPELDQLAGIKIYPNPATSHFIVEQAQPEELRIDVIDLTGRLLKTLKTAETKTSVNIQDLPPGVYLVKTSTSLGSRTIRVEKT